jgi:hypothetical protein
MECGRRSRCGSVACALCGPVVRCLLLREECCFTMERASVTVWSTVRYGSCAKVRQGRVAPSLFDR